MGEEESNLLRLIMGLGLSEGWSWLPQKLEIREAPHVGRIGINGRILLWQDLLRRGRVYFVMGGFTALWEGLFVALFLLLLSNLF